MRLYICWGVWLNVLAIIYFSTNPELFIFSYILGGWGILSLIFGFILELAFMQDHQPTGDNRWTS